MDQIIAILKQQHPKAAVLADLETKRLVIGAEVDAAERLRKSRMSDFRSKQRGKFVFELQQ